MSPVSGSVKTHTMPAASPVAIGNRLVSLKALGFSMTDMSWKSVRILDQNTELVSESGLFRRSSFKILI